MQTVIALFAILLLYVYVVSRADTHRFVIKEYTFSSSKIKEPKTIVFLSDLHENEYEIKGEKYNEGLLRAIDGIAPDIILSGGDMLTSHKKPGKCRINELTDFFGRLAKKYPVFCANGNHETRIYEKESLYKNMYEEYEAGLCRRKVTVLKDKSRALNDIVISGLEIPTKYYKSKSKKDFDENVIKSKINEPSKDKFNILLCHDPAHFETACSLGFDLVLSGHVHGGIAVLPYIGGVISTERKLFPFYDGGLFLKVKTGKVVRHAVERMVYLNSGSHAMVISRGLGMHTVNFRFNNPGELVVIKLVKESE